ncbi:GNAT family N-acetyltransferase [Pseudoluteimonas lycopersici]|uniref:GNAT family N-acetyltransferase n=1 Tax=Pseudoluteimonas lycopersici TaxID=1324796 RepID=A0A516V1X7_9GAMM|nr:GNAT family N-acetyltransferase [Lysobacter lycopersici]QDQ72536.1 GNAT family N-acetyltransferase [Lysobacter lycopersici]
MSIVVRDVREHELDSVLALNNAAGPAILPLDANRLRRFFRTAEYFRVAERDGGIAGFLVGFGPDAEHDSGNYAWFRERYPRFLYIDRIVVASRRRGGGLGRVFYADVQSHAELRYPHLACEVFLEQGNDPALLFHGSFGFREVGQRVMPAHDGQGHDVRAAMLMKELCSYAWVRETYGERLPDAPWISQPRIGGGTLPATGTNGH